MKNLGVKKIEIKEDNKDLLSFLSLCIHVRHGKSRRRIEIRKNTRILWKHHVTNEEVGRRCERNLSLEATHMVWSFRQDE